PRFARLRLAARPLRGPPRRGPRFARLRLAARPLRGPPRRGPRFARLRLAARPLRGPPRRGPRFARLRLAARPLRGPPRRGPRFARLRLAARPLRGLAGCARRPAPCGSILLLEPLAQRARHLVDLVAHRALDRELGHERLGAAVHLDPHACAPRALVERERSAQLAPDVAVADLLEVDVAVGAEVEVEGGGARAAE